jgi:hypothetical protein
MRPRASRRNPGRANVGYLAETGAADFAERTLGLRVQSPKPLKSWTAKSGDFAGSFVFKGLTVFCLRCFLTLARIA